MRWQKHNAWKIGLAITGTLLLLLVMEWISVSVAGANAGTLGQAQQGIVTVQATPTEDATVTALNKEKLTQEVLQLKSQNEPDFFGRLQANATLLSAFLVVIGGLIGLSRWFVDRQSEREKRAEERFQSAVEGLANEKEGAQIGAAILLRTFLRPGYEQFYTQMFDLAVANLRRRGASQLVQHQPENATQNGDTSLPLTTLDQALVVVFKGAFPLARDYEKRTSQSLDATGVQLDNAYLAGADLAGMWAPRASLQRVNLREADLREANLRRADLRVADLGETDLRGVIFRGATLRESDLRGADLREAILYGTNLRGADLYEADLRGANLSGADLYGANLREANLSGAILSGIKGLTKEQLADCQVRGALVDKEPSPD